MLLSHEVPFTSYFLRCTNLFAIPASLLCVTMHFSEPTALMQQCPYIYRQSEKCLGQTRGNISTVGKLGPPTVYQNYHIG